MKQLIVSIAIIMTGVGIMMAMIKSGDAEQRTEIAPVSIQVQVLDVIMAEQPSKIYASGVVKSSQEVNLVPQVAGKIVTLADGFALGKRFAKGDTIAVIEQTDYKLAVKQEQSRVEQAELNLKIEEKRQIDAQKEWEMLGHTGKAPELASREPQLQLAKINLDAALAGLERANLQLARTALKAPFDCLIKQEQLDIGQVVGGAPVAVLQGTEQFQVRVSIPTAKLSLLDIPGITGTEGSSVQVSFALSTHDTIEKQGRILGLESELDPQARTVNLLIAVDNPLDGGGLPLMIGAYVQVEIVGKTLAQGVRIPASTLREGQYVLVADADNKLARKDVTVGWFDQEDVVLIDGVEQGDRIVTTNMSYPLYGAPLSIVSN